MSSQQTENLIGLNEYNEFGDTRNKKGLMEVNNYYKSRKGIAEKSRIYEIELNKEYQREKDKKKNKKLETIEPDKKSRKRIIRNGYDFGEHKVRYYNRTWESYTYQSCMFGAIREIKEQELELFINNYKYNNNVVRFKKGQKEEVIKEFEKTEIAIELNELYNAINDRNFD